MSNRDFVEKNERALHRGFFCSAPQPPSPSSALNERAATPNGRLDVLYLYAGAREKQQLSSLAGGAREQLASCSIVVAGYPSS